ncbi:hypothetical protein DAI22_11g163850 [Oryza sativa Japonica Group]|nr:hypothetical protein DAI22_11g163850 [Oryza sativa Japonica Group]
MGGERCGSCNPGSGQHESQQPHTQVNNAFRSVVNFVMMHLTVRLSKPSYPNSQAHNSLPFHETEHVAGSPLIKVHSGCRRVDSVPDLDNICC